MKPGKISKADLAALKELTDEQRAELGARFDEIAELETNLDTIKREKTDADAIVARAGEIEKLGKEKDAKIVDLETKLSALTQRKISYGVFSCFFAD